MDVVAIGAALGLAFVLGISSAPNAASALVASRAAPWRVALGYSFLLHALGALLGGTAVALTIAHLVTAPDDEIATIYAAGCIATIAFVGAASRLGLPTSATHGLVGGVAGAGLAEGGVDAVNWGGFDGFRPVGVLGTLAALVVAPILGVAAGWTARRVAVRALSRGTRRMLGPVRGGIWVAAGAVALTDGTNDGQKAMGVAATTLLATGAIDSFEIPPSVPAVELAEGGEIQFGSIRLRVLHTPGHTPGSVCLQSVDDGLLLSGDTLFAGGWGRIDLPGGSAEAIVESLARLSELEPATAVLPGHGATTTIGRERPWLEMVRASGRLPL